MKSGFISVIGRPNVGKSTLLNQIMGEKLTITSNKPQTGFNAFIIESRGRQYLLIRRASINPIMYWEVE